MKRLSALEAMVNAVLGLVVSMLAVKLLFPLLGWPVSMPQAAGVSAFFFVLSFLRSYLIRRAFSRFQK